MAGYIVKPTEAVPIIVGDGAVTTVPVVERSDTPVVLVNRGTPLTIRLTDTAVLFIYAPDRWSVGRDHWGQTMTFNWTLPRYARNSTARFVYIDAEHGGCAFDIVHTNLAGDELIVGEILFAGGSSIGQVIVPVDVFVLSGEYLAVRQRDVVLGDTFGLSITLTGRAYQSL